MLRLTQSLARKVKIVKKPTPNTPMGRHDSKQNIFDEKKPDNPLESWRTHVSKDIKLTETGDYFHAKTGEKGGPKGLEPTRFGDWEQKGRVTDF